MIIKELQVILIKIVLAIVLVSAFSCKEKVQHSVPYAQTINRITKNIEIDKSDLNKKPNLGLMYYNNQPFTGTSVLYYTDTIKAETIEYKNGNRHGLYRKWFPDGLLSFESNYSHGQQHGITKTWWKNGKFRSQANYSNGMANGIQKQWYKSGNIFKEMTIVNGKEEGMQKAWRENGKIYNNYEAKNGRIFGLKRASLCFQLDDEEVQTPKL